MPAEDGVLPHGRRVLLIQDLTLPAALLRGVGAEIIERGIAAQDAAFIEQHDAGQAALDTVKHADVNGIETVDDAPLADATGDRYGVLLDRRHHRVERHAGQFLQAPFKTIEVSVGPALRQQRGIVGAGHRAVIRIRVVADGPDHDVDAIVPLFVRADMGKGRIAAQHPAVARIHDAAADRSAKLKPDFIKSLKQCRVPGKPMAVV